MKKFAVVIAAVVALGLALFAVAAAGAQQNGDGQALTDRWLAKVAERLGVSTDELTAAMQGAQFDLIDEAVAAGNMTQEQADHLKQYIEENGVLFPHRPGHGLRCGAANFTVEAAAQVLGMEKEALVQALKSGQSLLDVAQSQGMSADDFKAALLDQVKSNLDQKVAAGKLTQSQADRIYQGFESHIDRIVNFHPDPDRHPCRPHEGGSSEGETPAATGF